jgi:hypothetical protein
LGLKTPVVTLDQLDASDVSLIKLDIEGSELQALSSARSLLDRFKPVVSCELLDIDIGMSMIHLMADAGYRSYFAAFMAFNESNFRGASENSLGYAHEASLVFVPVDRPPPRPTENMYIHSVASLRDLARLFFEMPRYGDETPHDRNIAYLLQQRGERDALIAKLNHEIAKLNQENTKLARIREIERDLASARGQVALYEKVLASLTKIADSRQAQLDALQRIVSDRLAEQGKTDKAVFGRSK